MSVLILDVRVSMNTYELFEQLPDGSRRWIGWARGTKNTRVKLAELGKRTPNEIVAVDKKNKIADRVNKPRKGR